MSRRRSRRVLGEVLERRQDAAAEAVARASAAVEAAETEASRREDAAVAYAHGRLEALRHQAGGPWALREAVAVRTRAELGRRQQEAASAASVVPERRSAVAAAATELARAIALHRAVVRAGLTGPDRKR